MPSNHPEPEADGYLRKGWLFREIASPLGILHSGMRHSEGWARCSCELAQILRKLDAAMMTKQKRRRRISNAK